MCERDEEGVLANGRKLTKIDHGILFEVDTGLVMCAAFRNAKGIYSGF